MKNPKVIRTVLVGTSVLCTASTAFGHGFTEFPKARQAICQAQGGYWWPADGSGIPNQACRDAFLVSGYVPFVQEHEVAINVADYQNITAVKRAIPDGQLCSAAGADKRGLDIASSHWQKTTITLDANNEFQLRFNAQTPHNPSFWEFYLSKPSFNADSDTLSWSDLDLIAEFDNTPYYTAPDGNRYYDFQIQIPQGRQGQALLYTRWQRYDPAGEGFYNCSDIIIQSEANPNEWYPVAAYLRQGQLPQVGERVWLRLFNEMGEERIDYTLVVTESNQGSWALDVANAVNAQYPLLIEIGVRRNDGSIEFDTQNLFANQVWTQNQNYTYQLSIEKEAENKPPVVEPISDLTIDESSSTQVVVNATDPEGALMSYNWQFSSPLSVSHNDESAQITAGSVDEDTVSALTVTVSDGVNVVSRSFNVTIKNNNDSPTPPLWNAETQYIAGDQVTYEDEVYQAKWWNTNQRPTQSEAWQRITSGTSEWQPDAIYLKDDEVVFNGQRYRAKWWTKGERPGQSNVWERVSA